MKHYAISAKYPLQSNLKTGDTLPSMNIWFTKIFGGLFSGARASEGFETQSGQVVTDWSVDPNKPFRSEILTREGLVNHAQNLTEQHKVAVSLLGGKNLHRRFEENEKILEEVYFSLAEAAKKGAVVTLGGEWLLDNFHIIEDNVREIRRLLPKKYYRSLPIISQGRLAGYPRVYSLAVELLAHTGAVVDREILYNFVSAYQTKSELSIGELWAVPIMLKLALVENLRRLAVTTMRSRDAQYEVDKVVSDIFVEERKPPSEILLELASSVKDRSAQFENARAHLLRALRSKGTRATLALQWLEQWLIERNFDLEEISRLDRSSEAANQISFANSITSLKGLGSLDWHEWFESVSSVDRVLKADPFGTYAKSDFFTRDQYRHRIEKLSDFTDRPESEIAKEALTLAQEVGASLKDIPAHDPLQRKQAHVGYYLVDRGREALDRRLAHKVALRERVARFFTQNIRLLCYIGIIALFTLCLTAYISEYAFSLGASGIGLILITILYAFPASEVALGFVNWAVTHIIPTFKLPRLDFDKGVPDEHRAIVVVHSIFRDKEVIDKNVDYLEVRFLANDDPNISFAILADLPAAASETLPQDEEIINYAEARVKNLNERHAAHGAPRFYLMLRKRVYNQSEGKFLGWERKRGKVMELNSMILGNEAPTTMQVKVGDAKLLTKIRYVITLDADTSLPRGSARRMIAAIAHPLNRPEFDPQTHIVKKGYAIIQPRIGISLESAQHTLFSRIFCGHSGLDPYTQAVSDVYQDLFQEGSYIGKGIYDVAAFERALRKRVPENALLSHDLFEGCFGRVALCSTIELLDEYPSRYNVHSRRHHRWVRGDWQLLPWLFPRVPDEDRASYPNPISWLGLWKLFDNLRRSLIAPATFLFFVAACVLVPGSPFIWALCAFIPFTLPVLTTAMDALLNPPIQISFSSYIISTRREILRNLSQALLNFIFLAYQSWQMLDAIGTTIHRVYVSKRKLLDWETHHQSERMAGATLPSFLSQMKVSIILAVLLLFLVAALDAAALPQAGIVSLLWLCAPFVAWRVGQPVPQRDYTLTARDRDLLHGISWDTWRFFDDMMSAEANFLPPDNIQLVPTTRVAYRTSSTNISLGLLSIASAYDLGFITLPSFVRRLRASIEAMAKLERYNGHLYNWYDIKTLAPLHPKYISTVDNGNLVGHLISLKVGLEELIHSPLVGCLHWNHFRMTSALLAQKEGQDNKTAALCTNISQIFVGDPNDFSAINKVFDPIRSELNVGEDVDPTALPAVSACGEQLETYKREITAVLGLKPMLAWTEKCAKLRSLVEDKSTTANETTRAELSKALSSIEKIIAGRLPTLALLAKLNKRALEVVELANATFNDRAASEFITTWKKEIELSDKTVDTLAADIRLLVVECEKVIRETNFDFLFDKGKKLFSIGYNVQDARMDLSYYDLLASEARLASLVAIAKGEIPQESWFLLGRGLTDTPGGKTLLSWSATMFEYLMPLLVTKEYRGTLLYESMRSSVRAQIAYGKSRGVPWGVSESGYGGVDFEQTYQYHAFGVPGLGLKRGLSEDLVISPYSTFLAMMVEPAASIKNVAPLDRHGLRGDYGYYESVDFTAERLSAGEKFHVVKSFLAHHQGMTLVALNNLLNTGIIQERFHRDLRIRATELLLHEKFPDRVAITIPHQAELSYLEREEAQVKEEMTEVLTTAHTVTPRTWMLSNGRYSVMVDNAGSGFSSIENGILLNRWREDALVNSFGTYIFVRDIDSGQLWSVAYQPTRAEPETYSVTFAPDKVEFRRRDFDIGTQTEITVSPEDNVEIRRVSFRNFSNAPRNLEVISYAEVAMASGRADGAHPAFSKMFIQSEALPDFDGVLLSRRPRSPHDKPLHLLHMLSMKVCWDKTHCDTSRDNFLGRGRTIHNAITLDPKQRPKEGKVGLVLDPVMSLRTRVELGPLASETVSFVTAASRKKEEIKFLAELYHDNLSINRAFEMAWTRSNIELRHEQSAATQGRIFQKLANAIYFQVDDLRTDSASIMQNRLGQSGLWKFGISGDLPIVLVRLTEPEQIKFVLELLLAQEYLRERKITFDLVILNEYPDVYMQQFSNDIESLIRSRPSGHFLNVNGGVFIKNNSDLSGDDRALFRAVARVILSGDKGSLAKQLKVLDEVEESAHRRRGLIDYLMRDLESATYSMEPQVKPTAPTLNVRHHNGYGGFLDESLGYAMVVNRDRMTPLPWVNAVSNEKFGFVVSESGGGYTWSENSRENRLTTWSNDPVSDPPSEVIYIRDGNDGEYWCATPLPVATDAYFTVEHHFGYSTFSSTQQKIKSVLTVSGATEDRVKWWQLNLKNQDKEARRLELYFYVDLVLGVQREQSSAHVATAYDARAKILTAVNHYNNEFAGRVAFIGSSADISGYTASRAEFLGRNRTLAAPKALEDGTQSGVRNRSALASFSKLVQLSRKLGAGFDPCGVLKVVVTLDPGEEKSVEFFIAEAPSIEEARSSSINYRLPTYRRSSFEKVKKFWSDINTAVQVKTPDPKLDLMLNGWLLYQTLSCRVLGRSAFYQSGGAYGFRDQLQDTLAFLNTDPGLAKAQILRSAARQFAEGDVQHWWHPPTGRGVRTRISDDYLWLPYVVVKYIEITGDYDILNQDIGFIDGPLLEKDQMETYIVPHVSHQQESLYNHCVLALDYGLKFGPHGLPLMGGGDWNDGMNEIGVQGKGESVWLAWFLYQNLDWFSEICTQRKDNYRAKEYRKHADNVLKAIEDHAWDGAWYRRAYFDDGAALGSEANDECKIDSIAQSWSVISKAGNPERQKIAMDSLYKHLVDDKNRIILLLTPPFDKSKLEPGYIKGYLPGIRENGGQYTHAATWAIIATAMLGNGTKAHELFDYINPISHGDSPEAIAIYKGEPFVTCGDVYSVAPHEGRAGWSWYTGSSGWLYQAGLEHIMGLKVYAEYFTVQPCVPASWKNYEIIFKKPKTTYHICVENPEGVESGVVKVEINGREVSDRRIPLDIDEKEVRVTVVMGRKKG